MMDKFINYKDYKIKHLTSENARLMAALVEIQKVAEISEGVEWYELIARRAIEGEQDEENTRDKG